MYNRKFFFDGVRPLFRKLYGRLGQPQVAGMEYLLQQFESDGDLPDRWVAYMLATTLVETGGKMEPVEEIGKGRGKPYGKPAGPYGKVYYGRGYPQLTWLDNYTKMGKVLGFPLVQEPERLLERRTAYDAMVVGMVTGMFTGKKLGDYINVGKTDYVGARRVVNGVDRAKEIAGYAEIFHGALTHDG